MIAKDDIQKLLGGELTEHQIDALSNILSNANSDRQKSRLWGGNLVVTVLTSVCVAGIFGLFLFIIDMKGNIAKNSVEISHIVKSIDEHTKSLNELKDALSSK